MFYDLNNQAHTSSQDDLVEPASPDRSTSPQPNTPTYGVETRLGGSTIDRVTVDARSIVLDDAGSPQEDRVATGPANGTTARDDDAADTQPLASAWTDQGDAGEQADTAPSSMDLGAEPATTDGPHGGEEGEGDTTTLAASMTSDPDGGEEGETGTSPLPPSPPSDGAATPSTGEGIQRAPDGDGGANTASVGPEEGGKGGTLPLPPTDTAADTPPPTDQGEGGKGGDATPPPSPPSAVPVASWASIVAEEGDDVYTPAPTRNPIIAALRQQGLYQAAIGNGEHAVTCPWEGEHDAGVAHEARYIEPRDAAPDGVFHCSCPKHERKRIRGLREHLQVEWEQARCKPMIKLRAGDTYRIVEAGEKVLARRGDFYHSAGAIVRLVDDPSVGKRIDATSDQALTVELSAAADWMKYNKQDNGWNRADVPPNVASSLSKKSTYAFLPRLNALAHQPYPSSDGTFVMAGGYDAATGIYAAFDPAAFKLPEPTRENAEAAIGRLRGLLAEFEFERPADRAAALSAMLTASIRPYLPLAPGFSMTASSPGSGKSYLAELISLFAGPGGARNMSYPTTTDEASKVVISLAMEQVPVVCFDDMTSDWVPHGALNRMLTSGDVSERILGTNKVVTAPVRSFVMGTGNNIRPLRDMGRRIVTVSILPQREVTVTKEYVGNPAAEVRENRARYVVDALTIIAAYRTSNAAKPDVPSVASYGEWSRTCRESLIWLGEADPAVSLIEQVTHDPDIELLGELLHAWHAKFSYRPTLARSIIREVESSPQGDIASVVLELPCVDRGNVNPSKFGRYLARNKNRIVGGLQLVEAPHSERRAWAVQKKGQTFSATQTPQHDEPTTDPHTAWVKSPRPELAKPWDEIF